MTQWLIDFHFLRPEWLLLLPLPLVFGFFYRAKQSTQNSWENLLPAEFLNALSSQRVVTQKRPSLWVLPLIFCIIITAMAGPSWYKQETPLALKQNALVVVFDLSLSMLASDQSPNRLTRARQKIVDLIALRKEGQTGLVVFAGSSHAVSPLTEDITTFRGFLPALEPFIMPHLGSNVASGVNQAISLLQQAGAVYGRILVLTDGLEVQDIPVIVNDLANTGYELSIIGLGTLDGGPIPIPNRGFLKENDQIVLAKPNHQDMRELAAQTGGFFSPMTLDNQDLFRVLPELDTTRTANTGLFDATNNDQSITTAGRWHDAGYWLVPVLMVLVLWRYRQQGTGLILLVTITPMLLSPSAAAMEWQDLWQTPDQRGMEAYQRGDYESAADAFENPVWSGTASFRSQRYEEALAAFSQQDTALSHFNRGNTLVELQRFEEALTAYEQAIKLNPEFKDAAENHQKLKDWLEQQQQQQQQQQQDNSQQGDQQNQNQDPRDQNQNNSQASEDEENQAADSSSENANAQSGDQQQHSQQQSQSRSPQNTDQQASAEAASSDPQQEEAEALQNRANALRDIENEQEASEDTGALVSADNELLDLEDQQTQEWLRRIPDDPGGLLRRKFQQQYQQQRSRPDSGNSDGADDTNGVRAIW